MEPGLFMRGCAIGFSIAAPVGAIGVLCIRRTLNDGMWVGFLSGLGAATADAAYGSVAVLGLTAVSGFLAAHASPIRLLGGVFMASLGLRTFFSRPREAEAQVPSSRLGAAYGSTFLLTLANPSTVVSFTLLFAGLGLGTHAGRWAPVAMVSGVFLGSAAWWLILSFGVGILRSRIDFRRMRVINRVSGLILLALGIAILCRS